MSETVKTGLIGHPTGHSKSPAIHHYWIKKYGLNASYDLIDVLPAKLEETLRALPAQGYTGFNVTIPHKQAVMALCDTLDENAKAIGAVNTVKIGPDGALHGSNTDAFGFFENIRQQAPALDLGYGPSLVLGAGGAARAVVHALLSAGAPHIILANRTRGRAEILATENSAPARVEVIDWADKNGALNGAAFIVNTTSAGMAGAEALDIDLTDLPESAYVCDIVYVPQMTPLLEDSRRRGQGIITGLGMLVHQARPAFELWHGIMPQADEMLLESLSP
jgi:shikimate dehydrogenase